MKASTIKDLVLFVSLFSTTIAYSSTTPNVPRVAKNYPTTELSSWINQYISHPDWSFTTDSNKIIWQNKVHWDSDQKSYMRNGLARVNIGNYIVRDKEEVNGHFVKSNSELLWNVEYKSKNASGPVESISIYPNIMMSETEISKFNILKSLPKYDISKRKVCNQNLGYGNYSDLYELSKSNLSKIYLEITHSAGSGGESIDYSLYKNKKNCE